MAKKVMVLMGGFSSERDVSLVSGNACAEALAEAGYDAVTLDVERDVAALLAALDPAPDIAFNALHGRYGEDGCVQGVLEILNIPYTHSGPLASALAMNKPMAKRLFRGAGIRCSDHVVASKAAIIAGDLMERPFVVKPLNEGSSVGVRIVTADDQGPAFTGGDWRFGDTAMVERYVPGREITVAVMGDRALGVTEIRPTDGFYDYRAKYTEGVAEHLVPAPLPEDVYARAMSASVAAHQALGCRGVTRADLRYDEEIGGPESLYLLEINTQPGMTPISLVPEQAAYAGIDFKTLVTWMVEHARCDG